MASDMEVCRDARHDANFPGLRTHSGAHSATARQVTWSGFLSSERAASRFPPPVPLAAFMGLSHPRPPFLNLLRHRSRALGMCTTVVMGMVLQKGFSCCASSVCIKDALTRGLANHCASMPSSHPG